MIDKIKIENFRCYKNFEISGFKRVNLIGGLNNAGKTILLEAILLNSSPTWGNISLLRGLRGEDLSTKELPEYTWDNFFFNLEKKTKVIIKSTHSDNKDIELSLDNDEIVDDFKDIANEKNEEQSVYDDLVTNEKNVKSVLHLKYRIEGKETPILVAIAHNKGISLKELNAPALRIASFIPASSKRKQSMLARDFGVAEKRNKEHFVLKALQIIDKDIEEIKVSVVGGVHLEIRKRNGKFLPISLFGDAINKILNIVLTLINTNGSIILVDEIENGIHHTAQSEFWKFIFQLSTNETFDLQFFATTHSAEMIKSFIEVSLEDYKLEGAYFELYKNNDTENIEYNLHDIEILNYEISNHLPIRGE